MESLGTKIIKVINNNVLIILDKNGEESVAMGKGIGFQRKPGQLIEYSKIEKTFVLSGKDLNYKLQELVSVLPAKYFMLSENIIQFVKSSTSWKLSDNIYITLTDHIYSAVHRQKNSIYISNVLHWDVKHLYPEEFLFGQYTLKIIKQELGITFPEDEASYIALHFVNARINTDENMEFVHRVTKMIRDISSIVQFHFRLKHPLESSEYYQLVNYIKTLAQKMKHTPESNDLYKELHEVTERIYSSVYPCTEKIKKHLWEKYNYLLTGEDVMSISMSLSQIRQTLEKGANHL